MATYFKRYAFIAPAFAAMGLAGCGGGSDENLSELGIDTVAPQLVCQAPETINAAGTACEIVVASCPFPLAEDPNEPSACVESRAQWPDGELGLTMPEPVYFAAERDTGGFAEIVYYFNHPTGEFDGWGLHHWNGTNSEGGTCISYEDFGDAEGTAWGVPTAPVGVDPNYGVYFVVNLRETANCSNSIPYNFNAGIQADRDVVVNLIPSDADPVPNPTGNFYILARDTNDRYDPGTAFPYPRTYDAINAIPDTGGDGPVECEFPEVANEDETECLPPLELDPFEPGAVALYLRGGFNDWGNDADGNFALSDAVAFHYADGIYTTTLNLAANPDGYDFKIADETWSENNTFGGPTGGVDDREVPYDMAWSLISGRTADDQDIEGNMRITLEEDTSVQFTINATDATNLSMSITQVPVNAPLYIRGSMNEWGSDADGNFSLATGTTIMRYQGNNLYSAQLTLAQAEAAYEFKVADPGYTAESNYGAVSADEVLLLNESKTLTTGDEGQNIQYTALVDETVTFTLDVTDLAAPILTASKVPYGTTQIFVRGGMNDWGNDADGNFNLTDADAFQYLGDGLYQSVLSLDETTHFFKIADSDWATINFGDAEGEDGAVILNEAKTLSGGSESANLALIIDSAANYVFSLNASLPAAPELTVRNQEAYADSALYIRGSINDWGTTNEMSYMGEGVYQTTISLAASTAEEPHFFKVATEDWETANFGASPDEGADTSVELGGEKTLSPGGNSANLGLVIETEGDYVFSIDTNNITSPTLSVFSVDLFGSAPLYLRGSMNDWGIANEMTANGSATYSVDIELSADSYAFKVATEDWETANIGGPVTEGSTPIVTLGTPKVLSSGEAEASNIELTLDADGNYRFNLWHISPMRPVLEVSTVE